MVKNSLVILIIGLFFLGILLSPGLILKYTNYGSDFEEDFQNRLTEQNVLVAKGLLFVLFFAFISLAVSAIKPLSQNKAVWIIVSLAVSIIAVQYLAKDEILYFILIPYGLMGIILTTLIPFLVFLVLVHSFKVSMFVRRMAWLVFGIIFVYLFISRYSNLGEIDKILYFVFFGLVALAYIFDKVLQQYIFFRFKK